ncbi:MAG: tetratricopeptide repeat protein [bacterium]
MGRFSKLETGKGREDLKETGAAEAAGQASEAPPEEDLYDYVHYVERGDEAFFGGRFDQALRLYSRALQAESTQSYPWIGQVLSLLEQGQVREADAWSARALHQFPEDHDIISLRAVVYAHQGMDKRAIGSSDYAFTRGESVFGWISRGHALLLAGSKNADMCFEKAMERVTGDDWKSPFHIGRIYYRRKRYSKALEYFQRSCAMRVNNANLWHHIGLCRERLGFQREAIEAYERSIEHDADFVPAQKSLHRATHPSLLSLLFSSFGRVKK